jgi:hypothetical protein
MLRALTEIYWFAEQFMGNGMNRNFYAKDYIPGLSTRILVTMGNGADADGGMQNHFMGRSLWVMRSVSGQLLPGLQ